jgi:hypothetical protein
MSYYNFPDTPAGEAAQAAYDEIKRAKAKHPRDFASPHEGYAVIKEELEEAWDEIKRDDTEAAVLEMVQVAAMALRFVAEFGKYPYKKPVADQPA